MTEKKKRRLGTKGYTLVEVMVVITIMAILAAVGTGVYTGYINKAKSAALIDKGHQIKEALMICEMEYVAEHGVDALMFWNDEFLAKPNDPESILYPYVGEITDDCAGYTLKTGVKENGDPEITGFTYTTADYRMVWKRDAGITVTKK